MDRLPHLTQIACALLTVYILYTLLQKLHLHRTRAAFKNAQGAQHAPQFPQWDHIYGFDQFRASLAAFREHRMLEYSMSRFKTVGSTTFSHLVLGRTTIMTIEPANLKVIQALEHKKWGLGARRKIAFKPLLGDGEDSFFPCCLLSSSCDFHIFRRALAIPTPGVTFWPGVFQRTGI